MRIVYRVDIEVDENGEGYARIDGIKELIEISAPLQGNVSGACDLGSTILSHFCDKRLIAEHARAI